MTLNDWIGPAVTASIITSIISLTAAAANVFTTFSTHKTKLALDRELAKQKTDADIRLAENKFKFDCELAERRIRQEKSLADWKRRSELAEHVLADFYKARDIFRGARSPLSSSSEGSSRPHATNETESEARYRDALYAPFERLSKHLTFFSELDARRHRFAALFDPKAREPFDLLGKAYGDVRIATFLLLDHRGDRHTNRELIERCEADIGWGSDGDSQVAKTIDEAVARIEAICRPILESQVT